MLRQSAIRCHLCTQGDFTVRFTSDDGTMLPDGALTNISLTFKRHDFVFGTAYDPYVVGWVPPSPPGAAWLGATPNPGRRMPYQRPPLAANLAATLARFGLAARVAAR